MDELRVCLHAEDGTPMVTFCGPIDTVMDAIRRYEHLDDDDATFAAFARMMWPEAYE